MKPTDTLDFAGIDLVARLGFALGSLSRDLRGHPLVAPWQFRTMVQAGRQAATMAGFAVDPGRLLAAAAALPVAVHHGDTGLAYALRHIQIQADWFASAGRAGGNIARLLESRLEDDADGPWARHHFGWAGPELASCIDSLAAGPPGIHGAIEAAWSWTSSGGDPMALAVALPIVLQARGASPLPLPALCGRAVSMTGRPRSRWVTGVLAEMIDTAGIMAQTLHALQRARLGLAAALDDARASSRLPAVAEFALASPAVAAALVVRHLTRQARRGGPLGRTTADTLRTRRTAVSRAGAGKMLKALARSGWLVELTGSGSHRAYALRDLVDLGIAVQPARLRSGRYEPADEDLDTAVPALPAPAERLPPVEVDFTEALSDLRLAEARISALLAEQGLQPRPFREGLAEHHGHTRES